MRLRHVRGRRGRACFVCVSGWAVLYSGAVNRHGDSEFRADESELARAARQLSATDFSRCEPAEIRALVGAVSSTIEPLRNSVAQLSWWHTRAVRGSDYSAEHDGGAAVEDAATQLLAASRFLAAADDAVRAAREANGAVRWRRR